MDYSQSDFKINIRMVSFLFCFMFAPPILPINFAILLSIYSIIMLLTLYKSKVSVVLNESKLKNFSILYIIFALYWVFIIMLNFMWGEKISTSNYITIFYQMILITPIITSCVAYIIVRAELLNFSVEQLLVHFILAGVLEGTISLMTFISPAIRLLCVQIMIKTGVSDFSDYVLSRRVYGFANGLYDLFGWGTGLIAILPLFLSKDLRKKYIWFIPLLLLSPLLNARTGLVMFAVGAAVFILFINNKNFFALIKKVLILLAGAVVGYFIFKWIQDSNTTSYAWILAGIKAFWGTVSNNKDTDEQLTVLFSKRFWTTPPFPDIIFGTGHNVYIGRVHVYSTIMNYTHSDVGYINYLWMVGIVGSLILYGIYFSLFYTAIKNTIDKNNRWLLILFGGSIALFNIKGQAFTHCSATAMIFTILFYSIYLNRKVRK